MRPAGGSCTPVRLCSGFSLQGAELGSRPLPASPLSLSLSPPGVSLHGAPHDPHPRPVEWLCPCGPHAQLCGVSQLSHSHTLTRSVAARSAPVVLGDDVPPLHGTDDPGAWLPARLRTPGGRGAGPERRPPASAASSSPARPPSSPRGAQEPGQGRGPALDRTMGAVSLASSADQPQVGGQWGLLSPVTEPSLHIGVQQRCAADGLTG